MRRGRAVMARKRFPARAAASCGAWLVAAMFAAPATARGDADDAAGLRLFAGTPPLEARLAGAPRPLPPETTACANCHRRVPDAPGVRALIGPVLSADALPGERARRGGPPSGYDRDGFCRLLRDGIDPAQMQVGRAMPRYRLGDAECDALWSALTRVAATGAAATGAADSGAMAAKAAVSGAAVSGAAQ